VDNLLLPYDPGSADRPYVMDSRDISIVPKSIVMKESFDWKGDTHPDIPFEKTVSFYEVHLKGFTAHPSSVSATPVPTWVL